MQTDDFDAYTPFFGQPDAVMLTQADTDTLDNWIRYRHVLPSRIGNRRQFNFIQLLAIDLAWTLAKTFKADISVAAYVAQEAAKDYVANYLDRDRAEIAEGVDWTTLPDHRGDYHVGLTRDADGSLRGQERGDPQIDSVMVVLPSRLVARRLLSAINRWSSEVN